MGNKLLPIIVVTLCTNVWAQLSLSEHFINSLSEGDSYTYIVLEIAGKKNYKIITTSEEIMYNLYMNKYREKYIDYRDFVLDHAIKHKPIPENVLKSVKKLKYDKVFSTSITKLGNKDISQIINKYLITERNRYKFKERYTESIRNEIISLMFYRGYLSLVECVTGETVFIFKLLSNK